MQLTNLTNNDQQTVQLELLFKQKRKRGEEVRQKRGSEKGEKKGEGKMGRTSEGEERNIDWRKDIYG